MSGPDYFTTEITNFAKKAAAEAGFNLSAYKRFVVAHPQNACTWAGIGEVGGYSATGYTHSMINGSFNLRVVGHELGHNLGLYHSHSLACPGQPWAVSGCTSSDYGDIADIMGSSSNHFNAYQKERLGWLRNPAISASAASPPIQAVTASGVYTLDAYAAQTNTVKGLKIARPDGVLYLEYRQAFGFDSSLSSRTDIMNGVVIHFAGLKTAGNPSYGLGADKSFLLDMTPGSMGSPALVIGSTYTDIQSGAMIKPLAKNGTGLDVQITLPNSNADTTAPLVSLAQPLQGALVSSLVTVTANASDAGGVTRVEFYRDGGTAVGTITTPPYQLTFDTTKVPNGSHSFYAMAQDAAGNRGTSAAVSVQVNNVTLDTTKPLVSFVTPMAGATVTGLLSVQVSATDNVGVTSVVLNAGSTPQVDTTAPYAFSVETAGWASGTHTLSATAMDAAGNSFTTQITVNIQSETALTSFSEGFERSDSTLVGNGWREDLGDWTISANQLKTTKPSIAGYVTTDVTLKADMKRTNSNGGGEFCLLLRYQDPKNHYALCRLQGGSSNLKIFKMVGGVRTQICASTKGVGNSYEYVRHVAQAVGSTLSIQTDGALVCQVTDTTFSSGAVGVYIKGTTQGEFVDNFSAEK